MQRADLVDLNTFVIVAEERSFTRASVRLNTSQSAVSHAVRRLEERLGVRLLNRTTRSVAPTDAGLRLLETLRPSFEDIALKMSQIEQSRDIPMGTIRISAPDIALRLILWPKLDAFARRYPAVSLEVEVDPVQEDIVHGGFDAGVRLGEDISQDMVAIRIGPDFRMAVVASPGYFTRRPKPKTPNDISGHDCINYRRPLTGKVMSWEFEKRDRTVRVRGEGQLVFNTPSALVAAAQAGHGLAYVPEEYVSEELKNGSLVRVLSDWCSPITGFHLYYPSRRQKSAALGLLIDTLRL
ncbi:LysR family transcriptional regulator [Burkholderia multivorans]|uniref:LysR family transcriptional regulator n=1 Tax=Burkholderia multivorans TaxID=87883 RepID=UPI0009BFB6BF|nr:LysR family transcriptional regulator [Burkholderia multivorans]